MCHLEFREGRCEGVKQTEEEEKGGRESGISQVTPF